MRTFDHVLCPVPVVNLSNRLRVANFSSPHPFQFEDGSVLPACTPLRAEMGTLGAREETAVFPGLPDVLAVHPIFWLTQTIIDELTRLEEDDDIDLVIVPRPVIECLQDGDLLDTFSKVATIRVKNRVTKEIFCDKFCR